MMRGRLAARLFFWFWLALATVVPGGPGTGSEALAAEASAEGARQQIETLHANLLDVMRNAEKLGYEGRVKKLTPVLLAAYGFGDMARVAVGSYWRAFTDDQKRSVVEAFGRVSIATYASRLTGFSDERFETLAVEAMPPPVPDTLVRTRLVLSNGGDEKLVYRMHNGPAGWRIVDVSYRGAISELATQRAQYLDVLKGGGVRGLDAFPGGTCASVGRRKERTMIKLDANSP
ncbi:MAG: ABC transporter substrate-binding protein [Alphaproteobacteria bacterium]